MGFTLDGRGIMAKKKVKRPTQLEMSRRGAAAMAHTTAGMSRILTPNGRAYDRRKGKAVED